MGSSGPPLLLLLWVLRPGSSEDVKVVNAVLGGKVDLKPIYTGEAAGFVWKRGDYMVAEWDYPGKVSYYNEFKYRFKLNISKGVLTIRDLTDADSYWYKGEALVDNVYIPTEFYLRVFPVLRKPNVKCNAANKAFTISCDHQPEPPTYLWRNKAGPITEKVYGYSLSNLNKTLTLQHANSVSTSLQCVVKNPAMEMYVSVPPDCFKGHCRGRGGLIAVIIVVFLVVYVVGCSFASFTCSQTVMHKDYAML